MKIKRPVWVLLLLVVLQITIIDNFKVFSIKPDLILIGVVSMGLFCELRTALLLGVLAGALKDIFGASPQNMNLVLMPSWAFVTARFSRRLTLDFDLSRAMFIFIVAFFNAICVRVLFFYSGTSVPLGVFIRALIFGSFYTALASLLVFKLIGQDEK